MPNARTRSLRQALDAYMAAQAEYEHARVEMQRRLDAVRNKRWLWQKTKAMALVDEAERAYAAAQPPYLQQREQLERVAGITLFGFNFAPSKIVAMVEELIAAEEDALRTQAGRAIVSEAPVDHGSLATQMRSRRVLSLAA